MGKKVTLWSVREVIMGFIKDVVIPLLTPRPSEEEEQRQRDKEEYEEAVREGEREEERNKPSPKYGPNL
jgi:hypothetical protein